jgi:hypothetical protein
MGIAYSRKKTEAPHYKKNILGFILDMMRRLAYLVPGWSQQFVAEMREVEHKRQMA